MDRERLTDCQAPERVPAKHRPALLSPTRSPQTRARRVCQLPDASCLGSPGRDAGPDTLRSPGLPRRRRCPLVAVVSAFVARLHPRLGPRGHRTPSCQTPVRDGPRRAFRYLPIDCPNRSPAGKAAGFEPSKGPRLPSGATAPAMPILPSHDGRSIRPAHGLSPEHLGSFRMVSARTPPRRSPPVSHLIPSPLTRFPGSGTRCAGRR